MEGSIPTGYINSSELQLFDLSYNLLKGNLAGKFVKTKYLSLLFVQGNKFTGNIVEVFDGVYLDLIVNINLSDNYFTGKEFELL